MIASTLKLVVLEPNFRAHAFAVGRVKDVLVRNRRTRPYVGALLTAGCKSARPAG